MKKVKVGIIGPGNIGTDLMYKVMKSEILEMRLMAGIVESEGIKRAESLGFLTSIDGVEAVARDPEVQLVFDATSAKAHLHNAPILKAAGKTVIDMTPAAVGPYVVPYVNLDKLKDVDNFNMVTCGGQATIPIIHAVNEVADVSYAEIVSAVASKSAGPGTRANVDEFTQTTQKGLELLGGADRAKAIIVLNPAEPPLMMTNTIFMLVKKPDEDKITRAVNECIKNIQTYVPGYKTRVPPVVDGDKVTVIIEVTGAGDFLPAYSGNLDIINQAAVVVAEKLALGMRG